MGQNNFYDFNQTDLINYLLAINAKQFHARQIMSWVYQNNVTDFTLMSDIGRKLQTQLQEDFYFQLPKIVKTQKSADKTIKYLLQLADNNVIETVVMPYSFGDSVCISTQVGCNINCQFCASGQLKLKRNLTVAELLGQVLIVNQQLKEHGRKVSNIVIMGTGEPLTNFDHVVKFIDIAKDPFALAIGVRHISLSTSGIIPKIIELADIGLPVSLAISLHATTEETRSKLMPINKIYPLKKLLEALQYYQSKSGRKVTIEYLLIDGVNDKEADAFRLAYFFGNSKKPVLINLIELNKVEGSKYKASKRTKAFFNTLKKSNLNVTIRKSFGQGIDAACGQLRNLYVGQHPESSD